MLQWSFTFLILALVAGLLGFGGIVALSIDIAQILFFVFMALFVISALVHALRGEPPAA